MAEEKSVYGSISDGNDYAGKMSGISVQTAYENVDSANQTLGKEFERYKTACEKAEAADEKYWDAVNTAVAYSGGYMEVPDDVAAALQEAQAEKQAAEDAVEAAVKGVEAAAEEAKDAAEQLEAKQAEIEAARPNDMTFVVHMAQTYCKNFGLRPSMAAMMECNGVYIKMYPQMAVKDCLPGDNIVNFGGCTSPDNPSTQAAAKAAADAAQEKIEESKNWFDNVVGFFTSDKKDDEVSESLTAQCIGECNPVLCTAEWSDGHDKVKINDSPALMRRCEIACVYGGVIILETSGQPE